MARAHLYGTPVSPGISLGTLHFLHSENFVDRRYIKPEEAAREQALLQGAIGAVREDLAAAREKVPDDLAEYREVIDAQIEMTRDPKLGGTARRRIA